MKELISLCQNEDFKLPSLYDLAQYILLAKCDASKAFSRLKAVHELCSKHKLDEIDWRTAFDFVIEQSPDTFGAAGVDRDGRQVMFVDYKNFKPSALATDDGWRMLLKVCMEWMAICACTLDEVRRGCVMLASASGMGWANFSLELERKMSWLYQDGYPIKIKAMYFADGPLLLRSLIYLCKAFLKQKLRDRIVMIESGDPLFEFIKSENVPPLLGGSFQQDFIEWFEQRRKLRARSVEMFVLEPGDPVNNSLDL